MMRVPIREQLALLILLASLIGLGVVSVATWVVNRSFVLGVCRSRLSLVASLKAAQLASNLELMQTTTNLVTTRVLVQAALERYNEDGNNTASNWVEAKSDLAEVIASEGSLGQDLLMQGVVWSRDASGPSGDSALLKVSNPKTAGKVKLPLICRNGQRATLGISRSGCGGLDYGYPPWLYPNLTFISNQNNGHTVQQAVYNGDVIGPGARPALLLGPWMVNATFSLASFTVPIINNTSDFDVLGWLTIVMNGELIQRVMTSSEGLQQTGETLLIGPANTTNIFRNGILYTSNNGDPPNNFEVRYVLPLDKADDKRHPMHSYGTRNLPFPVSEYPAVRNALTKSTGHLDNVGAMISGHNEAGKSVASGYAIAQTELVNWLVLVELAKSEVWAPINHLRDTILGCVFATAGFMAVIAWPLAHFSVLPIRRLREATARSVEPPEQEPSRSSFDSFDTQDNEDNEEPEDAAIANGTNETEKAPDERPQARNTVSKWRQKRQQEREFQREQRRKRAFRIPGKVPDRKHIVADELSDLTSTFNEMSDELMIQWSRLEERVQQRTAELELSKKAAEAANESKTLFIANISHELKTPLNGIMGMCAVCMQDDDPARVKRSLGTIYKSGDLLLNLLTDLLTFSKNQVGQQLTLDEKEFRLRDINSQILAVFDKQASEGKIDLRVVWEGIPSNVHDDFFPEFTDYGPMGTGRLKDMTLWGDIQRILQVVINLVSNALKFTPSGGSVVLTIRCLPELADMSRRTSRASRQSPSRHSRQSRQASTRLFGSESSQIGSRMATANAINVRDRPHALFSSERTASPPPGIGLMFEFEVTDTGPGIAENLQAKIFEPFVQGDLRLTKKFGGTGLGLSICSQLASLMQGSIKVSSTVGVGSTFTMTIPLRHLKSRADSTASSRAEGPNASSRASSIDGDEGVPLRTGRLPVDESRSDAHAAASGSPRTSKVRNDSKPRLVGLSQPFFAAPDPIESSQSDAMKKMAEATRGGRKIRVLVAEDNHINQEVVLRMLKLEDIYDVTVAKDGQEALDAVKESMAPPTPGTPSESGPFDLIFMDVQMPNVDGLQSTRLIREIGYQAPIVALTAFAEESNIRDCIDSGMNYFLSKPIKRPQLKKVLKDYCPPIPEENEEPSPTPDATSSSEKATTTIVVMNNPDKSDADATAVAVTSLQDATINSATVNSSQEDAAHGSQGVEPLPKASEERRRSPSPVSPKSD